MEREEGWFPLLPLHVTRLSRGIPAAGIEELVARTFSRTMQMGRASCHVCFCVRVYSKE